MARALLIGGTNSHAGKSWTATAICRWLRRRGVRVAPFKAQNMSLNSYPCRNGGEMGRAQVVQAEACGLQPVSDMNPILLKPASHSGSQVIVDGKVWRNLPAAEYYEQFNTLLDHVLAAYERLSRQYEYIVVEGAGSLSEINLKDTDLVNLGLARRLDVPVLLVADIDRGGVFASIVGTFALLQPEESSLVRSFAINRFRGDLALFRNGRDFLEGRTERPCLGVFPWLPGVQIDAEDSVALDDFRPASSGGPRVAILRFPRISNFTDFRLLPDASWITTPVDDVFDLVILPGTKNTMGDLEWLRAQGLEDWLARQKAKGAQLLGVCGGYQMLGEQIQDPFGVESGTFGVSGLGYLPARTVLTRSKTTQVVNAVSPAGTAFSAYEIHMGITSVRHHAEPFAFVDGHGEGIRWEGCAGTYLHGALENAAVLGEILGCSIPEPPPKDLNYDRLADWFEANADVRLFEELYL